MGWGWKGHKSRRSPTTTNNQIQHTVSTGSGNFFSCRLPNLEPSRASRAPGSKSSGIRHEIRRPIICGDDFGLCDIDTVFPPEIVSELGAKAFCWRSDEDVDWFCCGCPIAALGWFLRQFSLEHLCCSRSSFVGFSLIVSECFLWPPWWRRCWSERRFLRSQFSHIHRVALFTVTWLRRRSQVRGSMHWVLPSVTVSLRHKRFRGSSLPSRQNRSTSSLKFNASFSPESLANRTNILSPPLSSLSLSQSTNSASFTRGGSSSSSSSSESLWWCSGS